MANEIQSYGKRFWFPPPLLRKFPYFISLFSTNVTPISHLVGHPLFRASQGDLTRDNLREGHRSFREDVKWRKIQILENPLVGGGVQPLLSGTSQLYTADFIKKVPLVYTYSMKTIYLSLIKQVAEGTILRYIYVTSILLDFQDFPRVPSQYLWVLFCLFCQMKKKTYFPQMAGLIFSLIKAGHTSNGSFRNSGT